MAQCRLPPEVYSRGVGCVRPVAHWNAGKREEFRERKPYVVAQYPESHDDAREHAPDFKHVANPG